MSVDTRDATGARSTRTLAGAVVGGLLIAAIEFAATRGTVQFSVLEQLTWLARLSVHWALAALPVGVAIGLLERHAHRHAPSGAAYAVAVLIGAGCGAIVMALHGKYVDPAISETAVGFDMELPDRFLYGLWQLGFWGAVGAVLHATDLRHKRSADALRRGELARLHSERRLADARLAALHAQVEPEFVLATLDTVEELYAKDVAAADRVLDALIQFLREATPLLRRQTSTVDQECRLLQIFVRALGAATGTTDAVTVDIETGSHEVAMPPGVLVSLVQQVLGATNSHADVTEIAARVRTRDGHLELDLSVAADMRGDTHALHDFVARTERRLRVFHGRGSTLVVLREAARRLTVRITLVNEGGAAHDGSHGA